MQKNIPVSVFDTKPYDRTYLEQAQGADQIIWRFHNFRLSAETAAVAAGALAVCPFVNDQVNRDCLKILADLGVQLIPCAARVSTMSIS